MDITPITRLEDQGTILDLRPGVPLPIDDPDKIWLVLGGWLDLFLVEERDGEPAGARHHFLRVEAGSPVVGFDKSSAGAAGVIANPAVGSRVLCLERKLLLQSAASVPETVIPFLDKWVENLGSTVAAASAPKDALQLAPGGEVTVEEKPAAILPLKGVLWLQFLEGSSSLLGDDRLPPIAQGSFFPVGRATWLRCSPHSRMTGLDTPDWLRADPYWSGLQQFQKLLLAYLVAQRLREEEKEKARLLAVGETDARIFQGALFDLTRPLRGGKTELLESTVGSSDPLLQVCIVVGHAMGVEIKAAPATRALLKHQDPISAIAEASRIRTRQVLLRGKWWKLESAPMVGFFEQANRPIALLPSLRRYQIYDPATQEKSDVDEELAGKLSGFAYVFYRPFPPRALNLLDILSFGLKGGEGDAVTILLMGIAAGVLGLVTPVLTGILFDTVIPGSQRLTLAELTAFLVISAVATALFTLTRSLASLRFQSKMEASVQAAVWDRLLDLPVAFFRRFTSGDLARRSLGISQIREILTGSALASILTGVFSAASGALMFYYSWFLALIAALLVLISFLAFSVFGWLEVRILRDVSELGGRIAGMTLQFINGIAKFRVAGNEDRAFGVWAREFSKQRVLSIKARKISNVVATLNSTFPVVAMGVIFYFGTDLMKSSEAHALTTGDFMAFLAAFGQFSTGTLDLSSSLISILKVVPLYERARPILTSAPEVTGTQADPRELIGNVDIHHLSFRYRDEGPLALRDLSLSIAAGQFVAFVGPSGSGKSTLFRLLLGFETPVGGAIYYDGQDLGELDIRAVRRQIGVVLQNARLTTGSIFRNIVGDGTLTIDDAWEAARRAGFEEDLNAMPMGMHTMVSEGGGGLSGGQRQRLLIARAIVRKPRLVLFDEATSALDNRTQAIVSQSLKALNATRVVIAHRLSTVMHADRICVLDKGSLVEMGTYNELMDLGGLFAQLANRQLS
jgi:NHLM bacteriocin system ABC transporter ATP-binding protein